jgi:protein-S-isoprenylcysteine O-methyltransferase Ste14
MRRSVGHTGIALGSSRALGSRLVEAAIGVLFAAGAAWAALVSAVGPDRVGAGGATPALLGVGVALVVGGLGVVVAAQRQMGPSWRIGIDTAPTRLVAAGLFAHIRNPIYLGMILVALGIAAMTPCGWTLGYSFALIVLLGVQARLEERHLAQTHGEPYRAYAARVGRFLPGLGRVRAE